jgi:hypothetical protein
MSRIPTNSVLLFPSGYTSVEYTIVGLKSWTKNENERDYYDLRLEKGDERKGIAQLCHVKKGQSPMGSVKVEGDIYLVFGSLVTSATKKKAILDAVRAALQS